MDIPQSRHEYINPMVSVGFERYHDAYRPYICFNGDKFNMNTTNIEQANKIVEKFKTEFYLFSD